MWKFNKWEIGDVISHAENDFLEFQVVDIYPSVPEKRGDYLYCCKLLNTSDEETGKEFNYHEDDISLIKKGTKEDLQFLLERAIEEENCERAEVIKNIIIKN